mgnify:CR=1
MANEVEKLNTIAIADIEKFNLLADSDIEKINGFEFASAPALAFDAASGDTGTEVSSITFSHTCSTTSHRLLVVSVNLAAYPENPTVTSVTYDGDAMTEGGTIAYLNNHRTSLYYKVAPATGTNDVVITPAATYDVIIGGSVSFVGVNQSTPFGTFATSSAGNIDDSSTPSYATTTVSSAADEIMVYSQGNTYGAAGNVWSDYASDGGIERHDASVNTSGKDGNGSLYTKAGSSGANTATADTQNTAGQYGYHMVAVSVKPA